MAEDHLNLLKLEVGRIESGEFFLGIWCPGDESGHDRKVV
jgi:hypothetical protein